MIGVGLLMIIYVVFGGMLATTWVQIIKAILLMGGTLILSILVMAHFGFSFGEFFNAVGERDLHEKGVKSTRDFLSPDCVTSRLRPARPDLPRHGADFRDGRTSAHSFPLLHRPRCEDCAR